MLQTKQLSRKEKRQAQSARSLFTYDILAQFQKKGWKSIITHKGSLTLAN